MNWIKNGTLTLLAISVAAFELFNYATTEIGISNLLGDVRVLGMSLAAMFSIAFCLADVGGIARVFTPETNLSKENTEVLLGIGGWAIAAVINAIFTWYSILTLVVNRSLGNELLPRQVVVQIAPIIIALAVLLIRFMLINSLAYGIEHRKKRTVVSRPPNGRPLPGTPKEKDIFNFGEAFKPVRSKP